MASAASTMPGSVATLHSCSSEPSSRMASTSSASANTRAGTRMSSRAVGGTSQVTSSSMRSSDIEHHRRAPAVAGGFEAQAVVGDRLDEVGGPAAPREDLAAQRAVAEVDRLGAGGDQLVVLGQEDELLQPRGEQAGLIARGDLERARRRLAVRLAQQLADRLRRVADQRLGRRRADAQLELAGVVDPLVHARWTTPFSARD